MRILPEEILNVLGYKFNTITDIVLPECDDPTPCKTPDFQPCGTAQSARVSQNNSISQCH